MFAPHDTGVTLQVRVEHILGQGVRSLTPLSGGCVGDVSRAELVDGSSVVVKSASAGAGRLDVEAYMLGVLRDRAEVPAPGVLFAEPDLLIMEHVPNDGVAGDAGLARLADVLASMHAVTADRFGLERDTLIGPLDQPNPWTASWPEFFGRWRLQSMARLAQDAGRLGSEDAKKVDRLCDRLDRLIEPEPVPALIHGDLWSGNVLWHGDDLAALIDPGCCFGVDEVDLAMMDLFGGFGRAFWDRYDEARGIREGFWERRKAIYQLYPLLVHVRLFGGGYVGQARAVLDRFV